MINFTKAVSSKFLSALSSFSMLADTEGIVVGFSGGADSVCLLHLLKSNENSLGVKVVAAHVNHGIRGDEANRDQEFCRSFCEKYQIPFYIKAIDCIAMAKSSGETVEECGRRERYLFFNELCSDKGYKIATAHNSNDNVETVVFNLCRGASLKGAGGIPPLRDNVIRPLILCSRDEIEGYCSENGLSYVTDSTNLSDDYTRNNIRHNVLPVLEAINPSYLNKIFEFSSYSSMVSSYMAENARDALSEATLENGVYDSDKLLSLHRALSYECIVVAFSLFSEESLTRQKIEDIYSLLSRKGRLQIYGDVYCEVLKNRFRFFRIDKKEDEKIAVDLSAESADYTFNGYSVNIKAFGDNSNNINKKLLDNLIDCDKIKGNLYISSRLSGDEITLYRRKVTKTLKKLFNEMGVPVEKRDGLPVLRDDEGIVWAFGVGTNLRCRVNGDAANIICVTGEE